MIRLLAAAVLVTSVPAWGITPQQWERQGYGTEYLEPEVRSALEGPEVLATVDSRPVAVERSRTPAPPPEGVEHWRPLVAAYFLPEHVDDALVVMACETWPVGDPNSYNWSSGASGLFQHLSKYWRSRSEAAGWAGADIFDPEANIAVAAWLTNGGTDWSHWECRPDGTIVDL